MDRPEPPPLDRRALLAGTAAAGVAASVAGLWLEGFGQPLRRRHRVEPTRAGAPARTFAPPAWAALEAALDRLLPSAPDSPGARTVGAIGYLDAVLQEDDLDPAVFRDVIVGGLPRLEEGARLLGAASFAALPGSAQDDVLRGLEGSAAGTTWIRRVLYFALEALLGDPVHGCQPGEVGWTWLDVAPGDPRPTVPGWKPVPR